MRRTLIVTIETEGENAYRTMEAAEEDLLDHCDAVGNSYAGCSVMVEICVDPLSDTLIADLCNSKPRVWIIKSEDGRFYWSNEFGWSEDANDADEFNWKERCEMCLPMGGEWSELQG